MVVEGARRMALNDRNGVGLCPCRTNHRYLLITRGFRSGSQPVSCHTACQGLQQEFQAVTVNPQTTIVGSYLGSAVALRCRSHVFETLCSIELCVACSLDLLQCARGKRMVRKDESVKWLGTASLAPQSCNCSERAVITRC